jgi:hypothetical protein
MTIFISSLQHTSVPAPALVTSTSWSQIQQRYVLLRSAISISFHFKGPEEKKYSILARKLAVWL